MSWALPQTPGFNALRKHDADGAAFAGRPVPARPEVGARVPSLESSILRFGSLSVCTDSAKIQCKVQERRNDLEPKCKATSTLR